MEATTHLLSGFLPFEMDLTIVPRDAPPSSPQWGKMQNKALDGLFQFKVRRYVVTKHSWKGRYQRIFCVTTSGCITQHPQTLAVTNAWGFLEDPDISALALGSPDAGVPEFVLTCRNDKKSKASATRRVEPATGCQFSETVVPRRAHCEADLPLKSLFRSYYRK